MVILQVGFSAKLVVGTRLDRYFTLIRKSLTKSVICIKIRTYAERSWFVGDIVGKGAIALRACAGTRIKR